MNGSTQFDQRAMTDGVLKNQARGRLTNEGIVLRQVSRVTRDVYSKIFFDESQEIQFSVC